MDDLERQYSEMCDINNCDVCEYNKGNCLLNYGYEQGRSDAIEEYKASLIEAYNRTDLRERGIYFDNIIYMMANALIKEKQNG